MDDPFASLTTSFGINKTSMKDSKMQQPKPQGGKPASKPPAPQWQRSDMHSGSPYGSPSHGQQQQPQQQPFHNRYPSPVTSRTHSGDAGAGIRGSNSGSSLDSLGNFTELGLGATNKNQPMKSSPMSKGSQSSAPVGSSLAASSDPVGQAQASQPKPTSPAVRISSDDFDSIFGGAALKAPSEGVIGVDVFGGSVPYQSAAKAAASSTDPFDMFGDIGGTAVDHVSPPPAAAPPPPASSPTPPTQRVSSSLIPGFSGDFTSEVQAAEQEMADFHVMEPTIENVAPPAYEEPEAPPSYEDVLQQARMPPPQASVPEPAGNSPECAQESISANSSGRGEQLSRKKSGTMGGQGVPVSSLFGKLGKEGNKLGGLLMKHGAKAAQHAQKAVSQGVAQVREAVNENMHRSQSSEWRHGADGSVMDGDPLPSAVHIKMAETLLGVDLSTRDAMLSAMELQDRACVEKLLAEFESPTKPKPSRPAEPAHCGANGSGPIPEDVMHEATAEVSSPAYEPPAPAPLSAAPVKEPEAPPPPEPPVEPEVDFLFSDTPTTAGASPVSVAATPTGLEEFLNPVQSTPAAVPVSSDAMFGGIFGDEKATRTASGAKVQVAVESHAGDTAERSALRAARAARVQERIDQQLRSKLEMDQKEEDERLEQADVKAAIAADVNAWKKNANGNVVALLANLQTVLWEGSGWTPIGMGDLLSDAGVKKGWRKANLLVHPDKVKQKGGDTARVVRADMIFDVLKLAYQNYKPMGC